MKKKLIITLSSVMLVALLVIGGTLAWFTGNDEVDNSFTAGTVEVEINEHDFTDISNWNPGDTTDKQVSVISKGTKRSYVRVSLNPVWMNGNEEEDLPITNVQLDMAENWRDYWTLDDDGWYYYKEILEENEETELLLASVTLLGEETGNEYQGMTLKVNVKAEAVQASHYAFRDAWRKPANALVPAQGVEEWTE